MPASASLDDTAPVPTRNPQTDDDYKEGGQKLLDRALRLYPAAGGPIEAFIRLCDNPDWVLRSSTTRTYPFGNIYAERGKARYIIVVKMRCSYQVSGILNPTYNLFTVAAFLPLTLLAVPSVLW